MTIFHRIFTTVGMTFLFSEVLSFHSTKKSAKARSRTALFGPNKGVNTTCSRPWILAMKQMRHRQMDFGKLEDVPEFRFQNVARRCGIACWEGALELQESIARCSDREHRGEEVVSDVQ